MAKHLVIAGHGGSDPGASGNGTNERDFLRNEFIPAMEKYAPNNMDFHTKDNFFQQRHANTLTGYDEVTELHLDWAPGNPSGGHVIIHSRFNPDDIDKSIRDVVRNRVGLRSGDGFSRRSDLYNLNVFANRGITYRLVELGFINNANDMRKIRNNINGYAKDLVDAMTGNESVKPKKEISQPGVPTSDYTGNSIVDYLISIDMDHSFDARKVYAAEYGISNYRGTEEQNLQLLNLMRDGEKAPERSEPSANLVVDGKWGNATTEAAQIALGTHADGIISRQRRNTVTESLYGNTVRFSSSGDSPFIRALQRLVGSKEDGLLGPDTIRKTQTYLGTPVDGVVSRPSMMVEEMQRRLNAGTFVA